MNKGELVQFLKSFDDEIEICAASETLGRAVEARVEYLSATEALPARLLIVPLQRATAETSGRIAFEQRREWK